MSAVREAELYSLPEVSHATGIPLPDLQRLRRDHADELPSVVVGEARRYPDEALAVFRRLHGENGGDGEALKPQRAAVKPRTSFSLSAQRRRDGGERPAADGGAGNGSRPAAGESAPKPAAAPAAPAEEVVDPGPPNVFDEMSLALGQLGGDDPKASAPIVPRAKPVGQQEKRSAGSRHRRPAESLRRREDRDEWRERRPEPRPARDEDGGEQAAAAAPEAGSLAAAIERVRTAKAAQERKRERPPQSAAWRDGGAAASPPSAGEEANGHSTEAALEAEPTGGERREATPAAGEADDGADNGQAVVRTAVVERAAEPAEPEIARPKPPLYTLQQIHERTGIPYSNLSLLAASHAAEIPSAGERYSPAYPLAGLQAFCRIYGEQNPGWEALPLGPEPGWDDDDGIARRISALEAAQSRWSEVLAVEIDRLARPWSGQAEWEG
jgi:hypothetical protein